MESEYKDVVAGKKITWHVIKCPFGNILIPDTLLIRLSKLFGGKHGK